VGLGPRSNELPQLELETLIAICAQLTGDPIFEDSLLRHMAETPALIEKLAKNETFLTTTRRRIVQNPRFQENVVQIITNLKSASTSQTKQEGNNGEAQGENSRPIQTEYKNPPLIMRTLFRQPIKGLTQHPMYERDLQEKDYDDYRDSAYASAIELRKDAKIIPPNISKHKNDGNSLGDKKEDIIDHIASEKMIIRSPELIKAIKEVIKYWPSSAFYENQTKLVLNRPYRSLGAHREEFGNKLKSYETQIEKETPGTAAWEALDLIIKELGQVLAEVDKVQGALVDAEEKRNAGLPNGSARATFDMLWMLYKPGDLVYISTDDFTGACRIRLSTWGHGQPGQGTEDPLAMVTLHLWYLEHHVGKRSGDGYSPQGP
jgi:hypothetical protein